MEKIIAFTERYIERPIMVGIALWLIYQIVTIIVG